MEVNPVKDFGSIAKGLARNPLGILALFIVLIYGFASLVTIFGNSLSENERLPLVYFLVIFPILVLSVFTWLVSQHASKLFAPADFKDEANYVRMQISAAASLGAAATKDLDAAARPENVNRIVRLVQDVKLSDKLVDGEWKRRVLWVDDRPKNNIYEREAFEAVGLQFTLSLTTKDALRQLESRKYAAIISDMERKEGPRAGYVLLDELRKRGDRTPLFFYAGSNNPKNKKETAQHGGQGSTNDSGELFEMVTRAIIQSK